MGRENEILQSLLKQCKDLDDVAAKFGDLKLTTTTSLKVKHRIQLIKMGTTLSRFIAEAMEKITTDEGLKEEVVESGEVKDTEGF